MSQIEKISTSALVKFIFETISRALTLLIIFYICADSSSGQLTREIIVRLDYIIMCGFIIIFIIIILAVIYNKYNLNFKSGVSCWLVYIPFITIINTMHTAICFIIANALYIYNNDNNPNEYQVTTSFAWLFLLWLLMVGFLYFIEKSFSHPHNLSGSK
jgi:hypothetical protein